MWDVPQRKENKCNGNRRLLDQPLQVDQEYVEQVNTSNFLDYIVH